jgi:hypothetical protein
MRVMSCRRAGLARAVGGFGWCCHSLAMPGSSFGGGQLRWYRFRDQIWPRTFPIFAGAAGAAVLLMDRGTTVAGDGLGVPAGVLLGVAAVWVLVAGLRSGIGVGAGGVTVRSALGWSRRVSWQDVTGFGALEVPRWKAAGGARMVAVVCRDRRPLTTAACFYQPWTKKSGYERVDEMLRALEAERAAAASSPDLVM